jgi:2'-5' RNA ligase
MRLFFALDINEQDKQRIAQWRSQNLSVAFKHVAQHNFHITLAFIGQATTHQKQQLMAAATQYAKLFSAETPITLQLDYLGLFVKPKVLFLGVTTIPNKIELLAEKLSAKALALGLFQEQRAYKAHVSLYRKANFKPEMLAEIKLPISINSFSLYESVSADATTNGVNYLPLHTWPLVAADQ